MTSFLTLHNVCLDSLQSVTRLQASKKAQAKHGVNRFVAGARERVLHAW
jgi:hypothetical protein